MAINMKAGVKSYSYFPQSHYHGVTIEIDLIKLKKSKHDYERNAIEPQNFTGQIL